MIVESFRAQQDPKVLCGSLMTRMEIMMDRLMMLMMMNLMVILMMMARKMMMAMLIMVAVVAVMAIVMVTSSLNKLPLILKLANQCRKTQCHQGWHGEKPAYLRHSFAKRCWLVLML